jgi:mono/diheme cytochrome c family protein
MTHQRTLRAGPSRLAILLAILLGAAVVLAATASNVNSAEEDVTYSKDVAPILQRKCQQCHQPNSIAPMSLLTYEDAKENLVEIKARVQAREMPPWHIDKTIGIQRFKNDGGLTDSEIATIVRWIDGGAKAGNKAELPPAVKAADPNRWVLADSLGPPDLIIKSTPYTIAARTMDKWYRPTVETGLTEARWVRAIEVKPSRVESKKVVHHALAYLLQSEPDGVTGLAESAHDHQTNAGLFMEWAVGKVGQIFPADAGKLMLPGSRIRWEVHYHAIGEEIKDNVVELGIYFYPKGVVPKHRTVLKMYDVSRGSELDIPPNSKTITQNVYTLPAPARLENFQPHMHMRGKAMSMEAVYPDGKREVLSMVNNFQWNWHINYVYDENAAPLLPKGTMLIFTAWHDNTKANKNNPDPGQWIGWGDRTVDEMAHCWVDVTYLNQPDFDQMVAARKAAVAAGTRKP